MKGVLDRLLAEESNYHGLCPDGCKQTHQEAVRIYRAGERISRAGAKSEKRTRRRAAKSR